MPVQSDNPNPLVPLEGHWGHNGYRTAPFMPCEIFIHLKTAGHWEAAQDFNGLIAVSCTFPSLLFITDDNCGFMSMGLGWVSLGISSPRAISAPGYLWVCP